jgi:hypothetical protein
MLLKVLMSVFQDDSLLGCNMMYIVRYIVTDILEAPAALMIHVRVIQVARLLTHLNAEEAV